MFRVNPIVTTPTKKSKLSILTLMSLTAWENISGKSNGSAELVKVGETDLVINLVSIRGQAPPSGLVD